MATARTPMVDDIVRYYPGDLMHGGMFLHPAPITRVGSDTYVNL